MTWYLGIDIGSETTKAALFLEERLLVCDKCASGIDYRTAARQVRQTVLTQTGIDATQLAITLVTGHGSGIMEIGDAHLSDVPCCARGIRHVLPTVRSVIDIQAQCLHVMALDDNGQIRDLAVSEKCASASGAFIHIIANILQVGLEEVGPLALTASQPVVFTTGCAVFGESEAISRVAEGAPKQDILAGVHLILADKIRSMAERITAQPPYAICGGGGLNVGLIHSLSAAGLSVLVPPQPEMINAIGAALYAHDKSGS